jgi:mono/diheme cytochrome c family protein
MTKTIQSLAMLAVVASMIAAAQMSMAANAKDGEAIYAAKCKNCHSADGSGNAAIAKMMNVTLKPLGGASVQAKSDTDLKTCITAGTGKMKPVSGLTSSDVANLVAYIRSLKK